jgi:hypothetical protein
MLTLLFAAAFLVSTALAGDAIKASVEPAADPAPLVTANGAGYTPGTYAIGTVRLVYTVIANAFTPGDFATFTLNLENTAGYSGGNATGYPVTLSLVQTGSTNLTLTPATATFAVGNSSWQDSTTVKISIPAGVPNDDGTVLVGNLQLRTSPPGNHLDTVTSVQVHIRLVYPALGQCLRTYNFVTDESLAALTPPVTVNVKQGSIKSTQPGQFSNDVLVVNACSEAQTFDLGVGLDAAFQTHPSGNPGNAVFTFVTAGTAVPTVTTIGSYAPGDGTPQHQSLCLPALTVQPNQTLLTTVHMGIDTQTPPLALPANAFQFQATLSAPAAVCGAGSLYQQASPNPVSTILPYAQK